jgi:hypothetical protein
MFLLPLVASLCSIVVARRAQLADPGRSVPPGLILGVIGLAVWVPVGVVAIANSP